MSKGTEKLLIADIFIAASAIAYFAFGILFRLRHSWHRGCVSSQQVGLAVPQGPAVFETSLQDRISSTDTSLTLNLCHGTWGHRSLRLQLLRDRRRPHGHGVCLRYGL